MKNKQPLVKVIRYHDSTVVYIKDIMHLSFKNEHLLGIKSWAYTGRKTYHIEYTFVGGSIESEYDNREIWVDILNGLDAYIA